MEKKEKYEGFVTVHRFFKEENYKSGLKARGPKFIFSLNKPKARDHVGQWLKILIDFFKA